VREDEFAGDVHGNERRKTEYHDGFVAHKIIAEIRKTTDKRGNADNKKRIRSGGLGLKVEEIDQDRDREYGAATTYQSKRNANENG
jgi:hypothetical protein